MENLKAETRAGVLVEALPYLQEYNGKIVVVKYGGNAMINEDLKQAVIRDIVLLNLVGVKVVLVHGGGPEIGELLKKTGKESKFIKGLRYTDKETMEALIAYFPLPRNRIRIPSKSIMSAQFHHVMLCRIHAYWLICMPFRLLNVVIIIISLIL